MSINWVMLPPQSSQSTPFTPLPGEQTLYSSPPRTSFALSSLGKFPAHSPFSLSSASGTLHLTSKRIIYLPTASTQAFQSFAAPLLNLQDSHVSAPWIGPNVWSALVRPVQGGNLPAVHSALEVKITFRDGGAFDFSAMYERVRERVTQAVERARESGRMVGEGAEVGRGRGPGAMDGVEVVMEDLPRYEATAGGAPGVGSQHTSAADQGTAAAPERPAAPTHRGQESANLSNSATNGVASTPAPAFTPPDEPPPGYEQVQRETIEDEFSRRMSEQLHSGRERTESPA